jgi:trehalose 6-phosphate synthase
VPNVTSPIVLVSNRGPLSFSDVDGQVVAKRGAGGLVSGLAPLVVGTDTMWIAAALSDGDRAAAAEGVIDAEGMRVRTLAIDPTVLRQAYDIICNATLWFLYHGLHDLSRRPLIDDGWREAWASYRTYNEAFADVVATDAPPDATVLVQDYHLALLGPMLRAARPDLTTVHFSHTSSREWPATISVASIPRDGLPTSRRPARTCSVARRPPSSPLWRPMPTTSARFPAALHARPPSPSSTTISATGS